MVNLNQFSQLNEVRKWHCNRQVSQEPGIIKIKYFFLKPLTPNDLYRVSQEESARFRESVPCVKLYRYNPKHLHLKLNGYGDNGQRKVWSSCGFHVLYLFSWLTRTRISHVLESGTQSVSQSAL